MKKDKLLEVLASVAAIAVFILLWVATGFFVFPVP